MTGTALAERLSRLTPEQREELVRLAGSRARGGGSIPRIDRGTGRVPMSFAQRRLHFLQTLEPDSAAYNVIEALRLAGPLDLDTVRAALSTVVGRHEVLRSTVVSGGAEPELAVGEVAVDVEFGDTRDFLVRAAERPFRLDSAYPLRVAVAQLAEDEHVIMFVVHHIASDAWSSRLLVREFLAAYRGAELPPLPVQYADFAAWQRDRLDEDAMRGHLEHWREVLAGAPAVLELPVLGPRPVNRSDRGAEFDVPLDSALYQRLRVVARELGVTPFVLLLTAFGYVLHRHCATEDVVLGTPVAGRDHPEVEQLLGCFVNTLLLRLDFGPSLTIRELVRRVSERTLDAYDHQELPFERLVAELRTELDHGAGQPIQAMFNYHAATSLETDVPGLAVAPFELNAARARFDLSCTVVEANGALRTRLTYAVDLLSPDTVARIGRHFVEVLEVLLSDVDAPAGALPVVPAEDAALVYAPPVRAPRHGEPLLTRFERHAASDPTREAVRCRDEVVDYRELNERANRLARYLLANGVRHGDHVALLLERSIDCVVAMLAAQKAGATYVVLDPAAPDSHVHAVLAEVPGAILVTHNEVDRPWREPSTMVLDDIAGELAAYPATNLGRRPVPEDAMYVVFTSGSTGRPKGVVVEHRNFTNYLTGILDRLDVPDGLHFALVSTLAADLGLTNLYGALATGGTVHVLPYEWAVDPEQLAAYFRRHPIDFLKLVPSHLQAVADAGLLDAVVPARILVLAGEACPWDLVEAVRGVRPDCAIWNNYGPSETTVAVLAQRAPATRPVGAPVVPLGTPIGNVGVRVVDAHLRPLPVGATGELLITGVGVARGYLDAVDTGGQQFLPDPCDRAGRAYRSGDRGRLLPDGTFEFLGRIDRQAKIRGYRVEPGYIEAVLRAHPAITDAAVAVRPDAAGRARLIAYIIHNGRPVDPLEHARAKLPPYMVPAAFVALERFPITPNGKLDWRALPEPEPVAVTTSGPPRDARDEQIAACFRDVLNLSEVGIDDDFFALGGDSFSAMRLARAVGDGLRVAAIFQHPTVRELANLLAGERSTGVLIRLPGNASAAVTRATVVAVPYGGGNAAAYADLAKALPPEFPLYAVDPPGHDVADPTGEPQAWDELAARAVAEIRAGIDGPVVVYGHCLGAALAYDIADRLRADGVEVPGVIFGGAFPSPRLPGRLFDRWARLVPTDRWRSDRLYRDMLRGIGGLDGELEPEEQAVILRALRHDSRQAEEFYTLRCHDSRHERTLPALAVVGERDRLTEFHQERYREWDLLCASTELEVIPDARHFFFKHQATELATIMVRWLDKRLASRQPALLQPKPVPSGASRLRGFALVTLGQLASMIGTRALMFGLGVWVYLKTGSATQFSVILVAGLLPALLVLPYAGAAADRWNRRLVMIAGDLVAVVGSGLCLTLYATGSLQLWHLYLATGLSAVAGSFQQPAYLAATAQLVPKQYLGRTNGITQALVAVSQAAGPLLGGALIVLIGLGGLLIVDLGTVVVSLATLLAVRFPDTLFRRREESIWKEIGGGVRYIARRRSFVAMVVFFLGFNLILGFAIALTAPMVLSFASAGALSVASTVGAVGGIAGGLAMALWGGFERRATGMVGFTLLTGAGMVLIGLRPSAVLLAVGLAAIAASLALLNGHWQTMIQTKVGMELQGRILASNRMIANLTEPLGYLCAGALADALFEPAMRDAGWLRDSVGAVLGTGPGRGMALLVVVLGLGQIVLSVIGLRWRTLHYMEDALPDAIPGAVVTWDRDVLQREADEMLAGRNVQSEPSRPGHDVRHERSTTGHGDV